MLTLRRYNDTIIGVIFLIIAGFYYNGSFFKTSILMKAQYGPEFMPRVYCIFFVILSITLIIRNIRTVRKEKDEVRQNIIVNKNTILRTLATVVLASLYISGLKTIGFLVSSIVYITAQLCIIAPRNKMTPAWFAFFSILISIILDYIFVKFFFLSLPKGVLGF